MAVLNDEALHLRAKAGLVKPYHPEAVNPASIDLHLGPDLLLETVDEAGPGFTLYQLAELHSEADPFLLQPGQFILAATAEQVDLHDDLSGQVQLKSSVARQGLEHLMAGWIDPGFRGTITLELHNSRQHRPVRLWAGMPVVQLVLLLMHDRPRQSYRETGRYNGQVLPTASRGVTGSRL
jgi:dCTP deaminase